MRISKKLRIAQAKLDSSFEKHQQKLANDFKGSDLYHEESALSQEFQIYYGEHEIKVTEEIRRKAEEYMIHIPTLSEDESYWEHWPPINAYTLSSKGKSLIAEKVDAAFSAQQNLVLQKRSFFVSIVFGIGGLFVAVLSIIFS